MERNLRTMQTALWDFYQTTKSKFRIVQSFKCIFAVILILTMCRLIWEITEIYNTKVEPPIMTVSDPFQIPNRTKYEHCIEHNICNPDNRTLSIYYYNRTNFYSMLNQPVNLARNIQHNVPVVPRKVHFVLFGSRREKFKFYNMLALMAADRYIKPDRIYFWYDNLPIGKYWLETLRRVRSIYLVRRERPTRIYGRPVKMVEHSSDIARLEILLEYGGIYLDTDSIVVNSIDLLLKYDLTLGREDDIALANAMIFSKPWTDFLKIWYKEYKAFSEESWGAFSVEKPKELSLNYSNLIHIEETSLCRPNFREKELLFGSEHYDWQNKNFIVHLYMRFAKGRGSTPEDISTWNCTVGQVMRYIYTGEIT